MKKYYYFEIILCSHDKEIKVVKDMAYHCTEERMHEIACDICTKLADAGMAFNGTNAHRYFELRTMEAPSPEELTIILQNHKIA